MSSQVIRCRQILLFSNVKHAAACSQRNIGEAVLESTLCAGEGEVKILNWVLSRTAGAVAAESAGASVRCAHRVVASSAATSGLLILLAALEWWGASGVRTAGGVCAPWRVD
eukprot:3067658-Pleurochrysis_carterae.AAC.1